MSYIRLPPLVAGAAMLALLGTALPASAETLTLWSRDSGATLAGYVIDAWNASHADQIEMTVIPHDQMVTKFAIAAAGGEGPDILALDLIFMPDFMRAGFLADLTELMADDPNLERVSPAHIALSTYEERLYGVPFTPDTSILLYNRELFRQAGIDPDAPPQSLDQIYDYAKRIRALGPDIYGYYFSGSCPGCNIFTVAPMMWASGAHVVPSGPEDEPLDGPGVREVLELFHRMWSEGLIPESARVDTGANFISTFMTGTIGMVGSGNFSIGLLKNQQPDMDFGIAFLPGVNVGQVSSFAGGDVLAIPVASQHPELALEFLKWVMTDEPQLEVYAKTGNMPSRMDLAHNKYFEEDPRLITTAEAVGIAQTPWAFHFNDMVNDNSSPWIEMLQTAVFEGRIDDAIAAAKERMSAIAAE